jgi:hypothetical protein
MILTGLTRIPGSQNKLAGNRLFPSCRRDSAKKLFDGAAQQFGIEKILIVGDAYVAVCGLPPPCKNRASLMVQLPVGMKHASA